MERVMLLTGLYQVISPVKATALVAETAAAARNLRRGDMLMSLFCVG